MNEYNTDPKTDIMLSKRSRPAHFPQLLKTVALVVAEHPTP